MKRNILLILVAVICISSIFISGSVNAESNLVYSRGSVIDLKIPCVFEDIAYCDSYASCNITINYPNGSNLIYNQPMTYNDAYFNYTLNGTQTDIIGEYPTTIVCEDAGAAGFSSFSYIITSIGVKNEFLINIVFFILIALAITLFVLGLKKEDEYIVIFSSFIFIISGIWIYLNPVYYLPSIINTGLYWVLWGFGIYILIRTSIEISSNF